MTSSDSPDPPTAGPDSPAVAFTAAESRSERVQGHHESVDARIQRLEQRVDALVLAVRALVEGLERAAGQGGGDGRAVRGARLAHELLLSRGLWAQLR